MTTMNTTITIGNLSLSPAAYEEFYDLRMEVENSKTFREWTINPYSLLPCMIITRQKGME